MHQEASEAAAILVSQVEWQNFAATAAERPLLGSSNPGTGSTYAAARKFCSDNRSQLV
jgi:hypothetical protein